ncbi:YugN family protein [Paenibacillus chibensis]|uniref:YugN family protein n=1 Tax=Paenibacillus chibensis TaxID=59846 RepID=A0ABU6Q2J2_9BACL|nr:YugN family protein [Paenibacillus chibensis]MEC0368464.1 YugN family protein [Paenibacillus chibensis]MED5020862.1 YugN family protein [Paenibacillus chibensis]
MINLESRLENIEERFVDIDGYLCTHDFMLAGNWDYKHGYLDKRLDQDRMVWLRIPFHVTKGYLDGECGGCHATVKLGRPFVFKYVYNKGTDKHASPHLLGAVFDQFQPPVDPDAPLEDFWVEHARKVLNEVERGYLH